MAILPYRRVRWCPGAGRWVPRIISSLPPRCACDSHLQSCHYRRTVRRNCVGCRRLRGASASAVIVKATNLDDSRRCVSPSRAYCSIVHVLSLLSRDAGLTRPTSVGHHDRTRPTLQVAMTGHVPLRQAAMIEHVPFRQIVMSGHVPLRQVNMT